MTEFDDLSSMAVNVRRSLHWCTFLLAAMILILIIDLQLKRSIARQAVNAAALMGQALTMAERKAGGRSGPVDSPAGDSNHRGGGGSDHVDGSPPVATGADPAETPLEAAIRDHPAGRAKRTPGNGRRTVRPDDGS
jgi:hypothetical protein